MVKNIIFVWFLAVVSFFVLWALLASIVHRISEKRHPEEPSEEEPVTGEPLPDDDQPKT
ncbi:MAG: hypothetical protein K6A28_06175 [Bacteroidales bacterium]|nr:hypothetical protein [Bacteroidales bacterium]